MQLERRRHHRVRDAITGLPLYDYSAKHDCHCNCKGGTSGSSQGAEDSNASFAESADQTEYPEVSIF